jgi:hypothetical protein
MTLPSANIIICEAVLTEKTGDAVSLIRTMNVLGVASYAESVRFFTVLFLNSLPGDIYPHTVQVQMFTDKTFLVASSPEQTFFYGYGIDPAGPGASTLTTEFNLGVASLGNLGTYLLVAYVDRKQAAVTPLIMRRY